MNLHLQCYAISFVAIECCTVVPGFNIADFGLLFECVITDNWLRFENNPTAIIPYMAKHLRGTLQK